MEIFTDATQAARNKLLETGKMMARIAVGGGYVMGLRKDGGVLSAGYGKDSRSISKDWENIAVLCGGGICKAWTRDKQNIDSGNFDCTARKEYYTSLAALIMKEN